MWEIISDTKKQVDTIYNIYNIKKQTYDGIRSGRCDSYAPETRKVQENAEESCQNIADQIARRQDGRVGHLMPLA